MLKHMYVAGGPNQSLNMSSGSAARSPQHHGHGYMNHNSHIPNGKMNGSVLTGRGVGTVVGTPGQNRQPVLHPLLNTSKASFNSSSVSPGTGIGPGQQNVTKTTLATVDHPSVDYGTTAVRQAQQNHHVHKHSSPMGPWPGPPVPASHPPSPFGGLRYRNLMSNYLFPRGNCGVTELLLALGLLCVISLILGLLALTFLLRLSPLSHELAGERAASNSGVFLTDPQELVIIHEVAVGLTALTLSLDLCCLLVCSAQFLFALKLLKASHGQRRTGKYLRESAKSRICAIAGFFLSVPSFLAAVILYSILQFHSRSAIITSILLGLGIFFCGGAMLHNVYVWQKEKGARMQPSSPPPLRKKDISGPLENSRLDATPHANGGHHNKSLSHPFEISAISSTHAHELSTLV